jgi:hypothetical protein
MSEVKKPTEQHTEGREPQPGSGISAAGRKAGGQNRGTIKAGELREKLLRTGETPLEVLVDGMRQARKRHAKIETKLDAFDLETLPDPEAVKELTALMRAATGYLSEARECAKDAAPYLHPKLEPMGRFLDLPAIKGPEDIMTAQAAIMDALASGDITPDEGAKVSGILENRRRSIETVEFEKRLQAIEAGRA